MSQYNPAILAYIATYPHGCGISLYSQIKFIFGVNMPTACEHVAEYIRRWQAEIRPKSLDTKKEG